MQGESKLIVSMSFRVSALFKWKPGPCLDNDASSSWLHHGDLLVMDGRCEDEYPSLYGILVGRRRGEYHFSVDQEPSSSVSFGHRGRVLPAHVRKGFTRVFQHGVVPAGFALTCSVGIAVLRAFLSDCPLHTLP